MKKPPSRLSQIVNHILDYIPIALTVLAATTTALLATQGNTTTDQMLQWILLILVLLSTTQLIDRIRLLRNLDNKIDNILAKSSDIPSEIKRVTESQQRVENYREYVDYAKREIFMLGTAMRSTSTDLDTIDKALKLKKKIRMLMLDPIFLERNPDICTQIEKNIGISNLSTEVRSGFERIQAFRKRSLVASGLELRVYSATPTIGCVITDPNKLNSKMFFELLLYRGGIHTRPRFWLELPVHAEAPLYNRILNQVEQLWADARVIEI